MICTALSINFRIRNCLQIRRVESSVIYSAWASAISDLEIYAKRGKKLSGSLVYYFLQLQDELYVLEA
jgi:hypothetical protein